MANYILHKAESRGHVNHGWLESWQSFSFADYYNPDRMSFGTLRVLNDDTVAGGKGFGAHPHDNMEIISIPLEGGLTHQDNLGNTREVSQGQIQLMSTGSGVFHSEYNRNSDTPARFLQIWVYPNQLNGDPRYEQITLDPQKGRNGLQEIVSPGTAAGTVRIQQEAWFSLGGFEKDKSASYRLRKTGNGLYLFVIEGSFSVDEKILQKRDGLGIIDAGEIRFEALKNSSEILLMEVPMNRTC